MQIDVGLDAVNMAYADEMAVAVAAARLGYGHMWTGSLGDPFQTCALRWASASAQVPGGVGTAIGVIPIGMRTPADLALSGVALSRLTDGNFILGIGAGSVDETAYRQTWGITDASPMRLTRAYLTTIRQFIAGESVTHTGSVLDYHEAKLPAPPTPTPVYVGAVGPEMLRLGGELADGVYLTWCTPDTIPWARARIAEGASRSDRDPSDVVLAASVRVCVDDDTTTARDAFANALLPYLIGWGGHPSRPFRRSFVRMGFADDLAAVDEMRARGSSREQIAAALPEPMLRTLGYFGRADGAAAAVRRQVEGADIAVVRIVPARPGLQACLDIVQACRPSTD